MRMAVFSVRSAASFRNQSALIYRAAVHFGYECEERDLIDRAVFPKERWDRLVSLIPLWPRYILDSVRVMAPWIAKSSSLYGPVDGPLTLNVQILEVLKNLEVLVPSQFCREALVRSEVHVKAVVPHGIDPQDFEFDDSLRYGRMDQLRKAYPGKRILFSNINPLHRKGLDHLAAALRILNEKRSPDWVFILHTGLAKALSLVPDLDKIPNLVIEDSYNVLPFRQIALKTIACDVFVWPSLLEGFGLPLLEAMAAKRPIVCLDAEPMNELVGPREAWLFPMTGLREEKWEAPGCLAQLHEYEPQSLAEAMTQALDNPKEGQEKGERALKRSKAYHYLKVYEPLVKGIG